MPTKEGPDDKPAKPGKDIRPVRQFYRRYLPKDMSGTLAKNEKLLKDTREVMDVISKLIHPADGEANPEMTKQLERLESQFDHLSNSVTEIKVTLGKIDTRLEGIEKNVVTKGQAATWALIAGIAIFGAGWWIVQQYLAPIVAKLAG